MIKCTCGGRAVLLRFDCAPIMGQTYYYDVHCLNCLKTSIRGLTKIAAIAAWEHINQPKSKLTKKFKIDFSSFFDNTLIYVGIATVLIPAIKIVVDIIGG